MYPFSDHSVTVERKSTGVSFPCFCGRMISPTFSYACDGSPELISFYPLFTKSSVIQLFSAFLKGGGGYKGVHHSTGDVSQSPRPGQQSLF